MTRFAKGRGHPVRATKEATQAHHAFDCCDPAMVTDDGGERERSVASGDALMPILLQQSRCCADGRTDGAAAQVREGERERGGAYGTGTRGGGAG